MEEGVIPLLHFNWRRERDSNPHRPFDPPRFQRGAIPLGDLSGWQTCQSTITPDSRFNFPSYSRRRCANHDIGRLPGGVGGASARPDETGSRTIGTPRLRQEREWRRGWDSNPRYPSGYNGFRDRPIQPLSHLSVGGKRLFRILPQTVFLMVRVFSIRVLSRHDLFDQDDPSADKDQAFNQKARGPACQFGNWLGLNRRS